MATKIKEIIEVTHREKNLLTLAARQKGVPIEQLLARVAPEPPNAEHNHTAPTQCQTNAIQIRRTSPFG
tara:strand:+ start:280 stop:486 length:207 start_codon:yes stop_codon:yes gene_type:complete